MVFALLDHYEEKERLGAMTSLLRSLRDAWAKIERDPGIGLAAPRPYPDIARPGRLWVKSGSYWIAYRQRPAISITAVFYDAADIPGRVE